MRNWLAEIVSGGVGVLWVIGQSLPPSPSSEMEWLKTLGPGAVGLAALYISFRYAKEKDTQTMTFLAQQNDETRLAIRDLVKAINNQRDAIISCPARVEAEKRQ